MRRHSPRLPRRPRWSLHLVAIVGLACLISVAASCSGGAAGTHAGSGGRPASSSPGPPGASSAPTSLDVELDWVPNPDHVGLFYARAKGLFADEGLTVEFHAPSNAADPVKLVGLNRVDLAISYEPEVFYAQQEGLPVTAVASVIPVPLNSLIALSSSGIASLADLRGRDVGVTGVPSDDAFFATTLRTAGLSEGEVAKTNVGFNLVPSLLAGKVDAILGGYRNVEAVQIARETGHPPVVFTAEALGVPNYAELVLLANSDRLHSDPAYADAVRRFATALVRGTDAARHDPSEAIRITREATQYDPGFLVESVPLTLRLMTPAHAANTGCLDEAAWGRFGAWMHANGLIDSTPDPSVIATNDYLASC